MIGVWHLATKAKVKVIIRLFLLFSKLLFFTTMTLQIFLCQHAHNVVPPEMQAAALKHRGYSMAHRVITTRWLYIHKKLQFVIDPYIWPLKYTRANKSPNLFLQKWKKQHLDKLKEVKTPWVLDGSSSSYHLMIAYHTQS